LLAAIFGKASCKGLFDCTKAIDSYGGIVLWALILAYMVKTIARLADDYFMPSLERMTRKLHMSNDVAGATLLALGSQSLEFCASLVSASLLVNAGGISGGIGVAIGSAVFNVLVVNGIIGIVACGGGDESSKRKTEIEIWWYPLVRDFGFDLIALGEIRLFLDDGKVELLEGFLMLLTYLVYCIYMRFNARIMRRFKISDPYDPEPEDMGWTMWGRCPKSHPLAPVVVYEKDSTCDRCERLVEMRSVVLECDRCDPAWWMCGPCFEQIRREEVADEKRLAREAADAYEEEQLRLTAAAEEELDPSELAAMESELIDGEPPDCEEGYEADLPGQVPDVEEKLTLKEKLVRAIKDLFKLDDDDVPVAEVGGVDENVEDVTVEVEGKEEEKEEELKVEDATEEQKEPPPEPEESEDDENDGEPRISFYVQEKEKPETKKAYTFRVNESVLRILRKVSTDPSIAILYLDGEELDEDNLLSDYDVQEDGTLHLEYVEEGSDIFDTMKRDGEEEKAPEEEAEFEEEIVQEKPRFNPCKACAKACARCLRCLRCIRDPTTIVLKRCMPRPKRWCWIVFPLSGMLIFWGTYFAMDAAYRTGEILTLSPRIVGLLIISAGALLFDAPGTVELARSGGGGPAVANVLGSNVFDILFGLGLSWTIRCLNTGEAVDFTADKANLILDLYVLGGIILLFLIVLAANGWHLTRKMGVFWILSYIGYLAYILR